MTALMSNLRQRFSSLPVSVRAAALLALFFGLMQLAGALSPSTPVAAHPTGVKLVASVQKADPAHKAAAHAAKPAAAPAKAASAPSRLVPVDDLSQLQMDNAQSIIHAGRQANDKHHAMSDKEIQVALATSMQETKLTNLASVFDGSTNHPRQQGTGSDHDSEGLFQQRATWGSTNERMDPVKSADLFYNRLQDVSGVDSMRVTDAAQAVQVSATPDAYQQWAGTAKDILDRANGTYGTSVPPPA